MFETTRYLVRRCGAEGIGTFALVFVGTGAIAVDAWSGGAVSPVGIAAAFGLVVGVMIYSVGDVSGAHLNPAVSLGFWLAGRMPAREIAPYVASQLVGAVLASALLSGLVPGPGPLGSTIPSVGVVPAFALEVAISFLLMFVIANVVFAGDAPSPFAGLAIGATVGMAALFAGPITGASMNPARSVGPALVSGSLAGLWIYCTAPFAGAALAVAGCRGLRGPECCPGAGGRR